MSNDSSSLYLTDNKLDIISFLYFSKISSLKNSLFATFALLLYPVESNVKNPVIDSNSSVHLLASLIKIASVGLYPNWFVATPCAPSLWRAPSWMSQPPLSAWSALRSALVSSLRVRNPAVAGLRDPPSAVMPPFIVSKDRCFSSILASSSAISCSTSLIIRSVSDCAISGVLSCSSSINCWIGRFAVSSKVAYKSSKQSKSITNSSIGMEYTSLSCTSGENLKGCSGSKGRPSLRRFMLLLKVKLTAFS